MPENIIIHSNEQAILQGGVKSSLYIIGEKVKQDFLILASKQKEAPIELSLPEQSATICSQCNNVFASLSNEDEFQNDKKEFLFKFSEISTVKMYLQKNDADVFEDKAELKDNTLGTFFDFGFLVDGKKNKYIGYLIDWHSVLLNFGTGLYRIRVEENYINNITNSYSEIYCLSYYSPENANGTVKIESTIFNLLGDIQEKENIINFGVGGWYQQIRFDGIFGFDISDYVTEIVEYRTGQLKTFKDEQTEKFTLKTKLLTAEQHNYLKTYMLQADELIITDYNINNPNKHIKEKVIKDGSYEPNYQKNTLESSVTIKFKSAYNNLRKKLCNY